MKTNIPQPFLIEASAGRALQGTVTVPGDKSISHRSLIIAAQAVGHSTIEKLLEGDDVLHTAAALTKLGASIHKDQHAVWHVDGVGVGGLQEADDVLDMGNSGTAVRLLMGLVSPYPFATFFTGDSSLRKRPMKRVSEPLAQLGATVHSRNGGRLPLMVQGTGRPRPIHYTMPVASAQVKSAILLAGLNTPGITTVIQPIPTRDHSERMLRFFGAEVTEERGEGSGTIISVHGQPELKPQRVVVPGDPSSAAFLVVAALLIPGSEITVEGIGMNPRRIGLYQTLVEMGADMTWGNIRDEAGEPVGDLTVKHSVLHGVDVPAERAPDMIDEYPILSIAAACAKGRTTMHGLHELKVKESDRLAAIADGLAVCGVSHEVEECTLTVLGTGTPPAGGGEVRTHLDHRIAMSFLVCGLIARKPVTVDGGHMIQTSFPDFVPLMLQLGAQLKTIQL